MTESELNLRESRWRSHLEQIAAGSADSLTGLYRESYPILYGLAARILGNQADAEEAVLEAFERVWRTAHTFDPERSTALWWLCMLTRSRVLDRFRAVKKRKEREQQAVAEWRWTNPPLLPSEAAGLHDEQESLEHALSGLPAEQRQAVELAFYGNLTHLEISETLRLPLGTIKTRIRLGIRKLRESLDTDDRNAVKRAP